MKRMIATTALLALSWQGFANPLTDYAKYRKAVHEVSSMNANQDIKKMVKEYGLDILNVTWEDTGRAKDSALGPNISDMTIQAHIIDDKGDVEPVAMPVVRYPNFNDKTADLSPSKFNLLVGNEKNEKLRKVTLSEYLDNFRSYLSDSSSWDGAATSLLAARDSHVLVSAQMALLPVPKGGTASFNPVLFNYQSYDENPAVLAIVATREGTSATIIDNKRDAFKRGLGQRLFHNVNGEKASFTAKRLAKLPQVAAAVASAEANNQSGANMVLLIQVPLKYKARPFRPWGGCQMICATMRNLETMDDALIGHGPVEGPFVEIDNLKIVRDDSFPIRVTVQFYKATASAKMTSADVKSFRTQIDKVYANADFVGSLVTEGKTTRPTEHNVSFSYPIWLGPYWRFHFEKTGLTEKQSIAKLKKLYGNDWVRMTSSKEKFEQALEFAIQD